jgi:hypothetical protein
MTFIKRSDRDRRRFQRISGFPLTDRHGCVVPFNRSHRPDRRLDSLRVRIVYLDDPKK